MSYLLEEPRSVLVVTTDGPLVERVREATLKSGVTDVRDVPGVDGALSALETTDDVGCVVVTDDQDDSLVSTCETIRDHDPRLPVVTYVGDGDERLAADVTAAGAFAYVPQGDEERLVAVLSTAVEVYDRRRRRFERNSMFETLLKEQDAAIYVKDEHARHILKGSTAGDLKPERFVGKTDVDVYGESEASLESVADDMRVIEDRESISSKVTSFEAPDGTHWSETTKMPWVDDGEVKGLVGITRDITERIETHNRLESHREQLEEFTEYVTHDLRNPLQVAAGAIELARETGDEEQLERASRAVERAGEIIDDLSEHAENQSVQDSGTDLDAGGKQPDIVPIGRLVDDIWEIIGDGEHDASLDCSFPSTATATASQASLRPVIENLFSNAVRHGGDGVTVSAGPIDAGGFFVADDGPGIAPKEREQVLEKGYTTDPDGTGTGLELVSSISNRENWQLDIGESADGGAHIELANCPVVATPDVDDVAGGTVSRGEALSLNAERSVGPVSVQGDAGYDESAGRWFVAGSGRNLWRQTNEFHFLYRRVDGPVRIVGQITDIENVTEWSTALLLVRSSLEEDAAYGGIGLTAEHGTVLHWRPESGGDGVSKHFENQSLERPWCRVDRIGETVTTFLSTDGEDWRALDQRRIALDETGYVGTAVCSNRAESLCAATFEDIELHRLDVE